MASLTGREETVSDLQFLAVPQALVFYHASERGHANIANGASQAVIRDHTPDVQVFNGEYIETVNEGSRQLVEIVLATVGDVRLQSGHLDSLTIPATASFVPAGKNTLQPSQLGRVVAEVFRVGYALPCGQRCQSVYSEVYTHNFPSLGKGVHFLVKAKRHEVTTSTILGYRDRAGATCERSRPVNIQSANAGEVQVPIHGVPLESTPSVFSGLTAVLFLEGRIRTSLLEEILECCLQMPKGLLLGDTGCFFQPREIGGVAVLRPLGRTTKVVDRLPAFKRICAQSKRPVIGVTGTSENPSKLTFLWSRRIETKLISCFHTRNILYVREQVNNKRKKGRNSSAAVETAQFPCA